MLATTNLNRGLGIHMTNLVATEAAPTTLDKFFTKEKKLVQTSEDLYDEPKDNAAFEQAVSEIKPNEARETVAVTEVSSTTQTNTIGQEKDIRAITAIQAGINAINAGINALSTRMGQESRPFDLGNVLQAIVQGNAQNPSTIVDLALGKTSETRSNTDVLMLKSKTPARQAKKRRGKKENSVQGGNITKFFKATNKV